MLDVSCRIDYKGKHRQRVSQFVIRDDVRKYRVLLCALPPKAAALLLCAGRMTVMLYTRPFQLRIRSHSFGHLIADIASLKWANERISHAIQRPV